MHGLSRGGVAFCLGTATGLLTSLKEAQKICKSFQLPFHISHGDKDYGVKLSGSQYLYDQCQTPEPLKCLAIVVDGYHGLFSQEDATNILEKEIQWLEERIKEYRTKSK